MAPAFTHEALFYEDPEQFLEGTVPFVRAGLAADEPVLVAVGDEKRALLEVELAGDAGSVRFVDMGPLGRNPARIIPVWREFIAEAGEGVAMRGIGEPAWPGRSAAEFAECDHHESLINRAFAEANGFTLLCPYDASGLDDEVLDAARRNHPTVVERGDRAVSDAYLEPALAASPLGAPLSPRPADAETLDFGPGDLMTVRGFVSKRALEAGLDRHRAADLVLAVNELAANSMRHGPGHGTLRGWRDELALHFEIEDEGTYDDPLLGRARPDPAQDYGRGLWLVHQLCDLVQLRSGETGTVGRVSMGLA